MKLKIWSGNLKHVKARLKCNIFLGKWIIDLPVAQKNIHTNKKTRHLTPYGEPNVTPN